MVMDNSVVVFVLGGPGTGKGTHCARLKNKYGWVHLSTGDLFRAEVQRGTHQGNLLAEIMREGEMAPPEITLGLLEAAMKESSSNKFLIDGFPRAMDQVHGYQERFSRQGSAVMFFACTEEVMTERLMGRAEGRTDDNPETIKKRLVNFREDSMPVIEWYRAHTDLLKTIDANRPLEVVAADVDAYISGLEAQLGISSAAPAIAAAARAPLLADPDPDDDLISLDNSAPSQAPVFLDLNGDAEAPMSVGDPLADLSGPNLSALDGLPPITTSEHAASTVPAPSDADPFAVPTSSAPPLEHPAPAADPSATATSTATAPPPPSLSLSLEESSNLDLRPVVIIGPSGVGKGTLVARFMARHGAHFGFTVSHTTRAPRPAEQDGTDYHFVTREEMQQAVDRDRFLEHAHVHGNMYGTSIAAVRRVQQQGKAAILEIDVQGAKQVRAGPHGDSALFIFVKPPSMEELEHRLRGRGTEAEDKIQRRLENARQELAAADEPGFVTRVIVNNDLNTAVAELEAAVAAHLPELNICPADTRGAGAMGVPGGAAGDPGGDECACQAASTPSSKPTAAPGSAPEPSVPETVSVDAVKQYLRDTVVVPVEEAMLALVKERPADPLQFVIDHLVRAKAQLTTS